MSAVRKYARALSVTLEAIERSKMAASALTVPPMAWPDIKDWECCSGKRPVTPKTLAVRTFDAPLRIATHTNERAKNSIVQVEVSTFTNTVTRIKTRSMTSSDESIRT